MIKEIIIALDAYKKAHHFINKYKLWKWVFIPGLIYLVFFCVSIFFFNKGAAIVIDKLFVITGLRDWLQALNNSFVDVFFKLVSFVIWLIIMLFYFSIFKYCWFIIGAPFFAHLSEKTASLIEGKEFPFNTRQLLQDIVRGIKLSLRNVLWQTLYTFFILLLSFIPVIGWVTPFISLVTECYYYGFSMLDYNCERNKLSPSESIAYIHKHKGLAIGNGFGFYIMHVLPIIGWALAPAYAVIAATISFYKVNDKVATFTS